MSAKYNGYGIVMSVAIQLYSAKYQWLKSNKAMAPFSQ
jgi:hypothetical protein